jgi:hypothetical protein
MNFYLFDARLTFYSTRHRDLHMDCCYLRAGFCPSTSVADNILIFRAVLVMSQSILNRQICLKLKFQ